MEDAMIEALVTLLSLEHVTYLCFGVFLGLIVGILPGLGGTAGLALLLPFVFNMDATNALAMMIGLQSVTATSDTFPSVLMGIPGTASSQATVCDGFPLSKKGEAARALAAAFSASLFGGLFGAFVLTFAIFYAEPIINAMGFGEQMMLIVLALTMVGMLTGSHPLKGLAACAIGLMIGAFGSAPVSGVERLTFGTEYLIDQIALVIVGLAMFALPEIIDLLRRQLTISKTGVLGSGWIRGLKETCIHWWIVLRCACIGCVVGALPGLGGSVIDWIAYGHVIQTSKNRETFGTGDIRGVIAPEAANNAKEGGALIPTILFGIPGSGSMALLLGGFILIGIEPGVEMITHEANVVYLMIWSVALANIFGAGTCLLMASQIAKLTTIRYTLIAPFMFGLIFFAAFQATREWGDLLMLMLLGTLGVYMKRFGWPRPALLIGYVLSTRVETSIYHTITTYGLSFLSHPIVIILIILTLISIVAAIRYKPAQSEITEDGIHTDRNILPQCIFYGFIFLLSLIVIWDGSRWDVLTGVYPLFAGGISLLFIVPLGIEMYRTKGASLVFYDSEREEIDRAIEYRSNEYYLMWLMGMLGVSALFGFVLGIGSFIYIFIRLKAGLSHLGCAISAGIFIMLLGTLSHFMTLQYPEGILQSYVTLPWPLQ
ncbi:MAG: tripartite tricarboxylate transporter permease [Rhodospirillaceae bacterium]|jgi:TctA family transporter|nr:tripartite tricarboxylate transporter permease [Rhodospirillaceae bacterium]MBT4700561.1 tripartite tricarboxylate transporter permease [Rhodospirillaceae bacterium]MBT5033684.1 tripartite tricarboxylate transporter permease [Rhodospirillaceae bacterium]MBT6221396.1 tripartite tricarboxylate transporter permease [Rhodospirillaceae bacterium]MBT6360863.1 tripartite tricarboxylate transporter permease [Rhodospirillaceae bacterium]